jgi:hypothetical protein
VNSPSMVIVLAEDRCQQNFARRYLHQLGCGNGKIRFVLSPSGRGSGEQWVRERYQLELLEFRDRNARAESALVVLIDCDSETTHFRSQQLGSDRLNDERIVHLLPKRHIETWILFLTGATVTELDDCKSSINETSIPRATQQAAHQLYESTRRNAQLPHDCIPSLQLAVTELRRLET